MCVWINILNVFILNFPCQIKEKHGSYTEYILAWHIPNASRLQTKHTQTHFLFFLVTMTLGEFGWPSEPRFLHPQDLNSRSCLKESKSSTTQTKDELIQTQHSSNDALVRLLLCDLEVIGCRNKATYIYPPSSNSTGGSLLHFVAFFLVIYLWCYAHGYFKVNAMSYMQKSWTHLLHSWVCFPLIPSCI